MYQRLAIARALIKCPRVLLLDEPSRSLDPAAASDLWELIRNLAAQEAAVLLATHNFTEAIAVSGRIAVLQKGELLGTCNARSLTVERLQDYYRRITQPSVECEWPEGVPA